MRKIKQNERTLTNLLDQDKRVYLYFRNRSVWELFIKQAQSEGFAVPEAYHDYLALNNDMTFNSIGGMVGHMKVKVDRKTIYVIDFVKYINDAKDFIAD